MAGRSVAVPRIMGDLVAGDVVRVVLTEECIPRQHLRGQEVTYRVANVGRTVIHGNFIPPDEDGWSLERLRACRIDDYSRTWAALPIESPIVAVVELYKPPSMRGAGEEVDPLRGPADAGGSGAPLLTSPAPAPPAKNAAPAKPVRTTRTTRKRS